MAKKPSTKQPAREDAAETAAPMDALIPGAGGSAAAAPGYTVLARRYRSTHFDELIGQESIARTLQNAIAMNRIAHAYLFCGTRGVGKTSMARVLARALNTPTALAQSEAIAGSILRGEDMDVIEIDGASNRGVDDARDLISKAGILPARSPYKIYIIDEVHMLTTPAFNALLKTMEEPPPHVKFILCTTEPHKVPATIQSRCQRFDFKPIPTGRIAEHLRAVAAKEGLRAEDAAILLVARLGNGSMRDALSLLDRLIAAARGELTARLAEEVLGLPDAGLVAAVTAAIAAGDAKAGLEAAAALLESGCSPEQALEMFAASWRDFLVLRTCGKETPLVDASADARAAAFEQAGRFEPHELVHFVAICEAAHRAIRGSGSPRTIFDATVARLCLQREFQRIEVAAAGAAGRGVDVEKKKVGSAEAAALAPATRVAPPVAPDSGVAPRSDPRAGAAPAAAPRTESAAAEPWTAAEAWRRIVAVAATTPERTLAESFVPLSLVDRRLTLRASETAGSAVTSAARRGEILQSMATRALGPGWKLDFESVTDAPPTLSPAPMHGLDRELLQMPLVQAAMSAFDAIVLKVERPAAAPAAPLETEAS